MQQEDAQPQRAISKQKQFRRCKRTASIEAAVMPPLSPLAITEIQVRTKTSVYIIWTDETLLWEEN